MASCYRVTKLLYKKLESSLLDYLALSRIDARANRRSWYHTSTIESSTHMYICKYVVRMCTISLYNAY